MTPALLPPPTAERLYARQAIPLSGHERRVRDELVKSGWTVRDATARARLESDAGMWWGCFGEVRRG
jgi:hypothetical protein